MTYRAAHERPAGREVSRGSVEESVTFHANNIVTVTKHLVWP
jgi:hypothetical protein